MGMLIQFALPRPSFAKASRGPPSEVSTKEGGGREFGRASLLASALSHPHTPSPCGARCAARVIGGDFERAEKTRLPDQPGVPEELGRLRGDARPPGGRRLGI